VQHFAKLFLSGTERFGYSITAIEGSLNADLACRDQLAVCR
jgi:hypothetical protein